MSKALHFTWESTYKHLTYLHTYTVQRQSRLPPSTAYVVTCVGVWVVTEWSVSCLSNSQVITKS